jgi:tetratricopeptide (TPR) repeat protein
LDEGDGSLALRIGGALWQFWRAHEHYEEGRSWLREALLLPSTDGERAKALWGAGWLAFHQADYEEAGTLSVEALALARRTGDPIDTRNALAVRGMVAMAQERYAEALKSFEEGLELCRSAEPGWLLATSLLNLATATMHAGDLDRAEEGSMRLSSSTPSSVIGVSAIGRECTLRRSPCCAAIGKPRTY